jgi:hypothetical protein
MSTRKKEEIRKREETLSSLIETRDKNQDLLTKENTTLDEISIEFLKDNVVFLNDKIKAIRQRELIIFVVSVDTRGKIILEDNTNKSLINNSGTLEFIVFTNNKTKNIYLVLNDKTVDIHEALSKVLSIFIPDFSIGGLKIEERNTKNIDNINSQYQNLSYQLYCLRSKTQIEGFDSTNKYHLFSIKDYDQLSTYLLKSLNKIEREAKVLDNKKAEHERLAKFEADKKAEHERLAKNEADKKAEHERLAKNEADKKAEHKCLAEIEADRVASEKKANKEALCDINAENANKQPIVKFNSDRIEDEKKKYGMTHKEQIEALKKIEYGLYLLFLFLSIRYFRG